MWRYKKRGQRDRGELTACEQKQAETLCKVLSLCHEPSNLTPTDKPLTKCWFAKTRYFTLQEQILIGLLHNLFFFSFTDQIYVLVFERTTTWINSSMSKTLTNQTFFHNEKLINYKVLIIEKVLGGLYWVYSFWQTNDPVAGVSDRSSRSDHNHRRPLLHHLLTDGSAGSDYNETLDKLPPCTAKRQRLAFSAKLWLKLLRIGQNCDH